MIGVENSDSIRLSWMDGLVVYLVGWHFECLVFVVRLNRCGEHRAKCIGISTITRSCGFRRN